MVAVVDNTVPPSWKTPTRRYIKMGDLPLDPSEVALVKRRDIEYNMIKSNLYKICISTPQLRCLGKEEADYTLLEVHKGVIWQHLRGFSVGKEDLKSRLFMADYDPGFPRICKKM